MTVGQRIVPCLWLDGTAEAATRLYTGLFPGSRVLGLTHYGSAGREIHGQAVGQVMTAEFELAGFRMLALNGGAVFRPNPSISLFVMLEREQDVAALWQGLEPGGAILMPMDAYPWSSRYGWLADRYGVSWQIALGKTADVGRTIAPMLMFTGEQCGKAEAAMVRYTSIFAGSTIDGILRHDGTGPDRAGTVQHGQFRLGGETFMAMDSAWPHAFSFDEGVSLIVRCQSQAEIDHYWHALIAEGGEESQCGWLKDRFGVSWQVVPHDLLDLLTRGDRAAFERVMQAILGMRKLDMAALEAAHRGG